MLAPLAMLTGGRTCVDMEDFGRDREEWLRQFLTIENGIPKPRHVLGCLQVKVDDRSNEIPAMRNCWSCWT